MLARYFYGMLVWYVGSIENGSKNIVSVKGSRARGNYIN